MSNGPDVDRTAFGKTVRRRMMDRSAGTKAYGVAVMPYEWRARSAMSFGQDMLDGAYSIIEVDPVVGGLRVLGN